MSNYTVSVDLADLASAIPSVEGIIFQNLSAAVERVAMVGAERWKQAVYHANLWRGEAEAYANSITYELTGPYSARISATYKLVEDIETGRPPYDLKRMLDSSSKVRQGKKGRYLIIPMRHNVPGASATAPSMPAHVYAEARQLAPSRVTGRGSRVSGTGASDAKTRRPLRIAQQTYKWGGRLPEGLAPKKKPEHKTDIYAGMVRFEAKSGKAGRYSTYLTFRIMGEWQTGAWIIPARPGQYIAKGVADGLEKDATVIFGKAMQTDLAAVSPTE